MARGAPPAGLEVHALGAADMDPGEGSGRGCEKLDAWEACMCGGAWERKGRGELFPWADVGDWFPCGHDGPLGALPPFMLECFMLLGFPEPSDWAC